MPEDEKNTQTQENTNTESADTSIGGGDPKSENQPAPNTETKAENNPDSPSAEELAAFRKWQESQKSEAEKQAAAIAKADKARLAAEERASAAELKFTAMSKGVSAEAVSDVIALAKTKITDKVTAEQAIEEILKKYPSFAQNTVQDTGAHTPNNKTVTDDDAALRRAMGLPVSQNGGK